ncbi:T9SS type A sorting domain-containing protein, partial [bacterium]|nr:T9SS type A sorting domain-containing protein [bacterium]
YIFDHWIGTGSDHYSGSQLAPNILLKGPVVQTAHWKLQYYVHLQIDPIDGGELFPITVPGGWINAADTLELTAVGQVDSGYGFSHWSGDIESDNNPLKAILVNPIHLTAHFIKGKVIINSEPNGLTLSIDGKTMVSPVVFNWLSGEHHVLKAISPQGDNVSAKYKFREWSDGGAQEHTIEVPDGLMTYTAIYDASYFVTVVSDYGNTTGEGWYNKGEKAVITADSLVQESNRIRRKLTGWKGTGEGSITSSEKIITVTVQGPITEHAQWQPQFKLLVTTYPPILLDARIELTPPGPWFYMGETVLLKAVVTGTVTTFIGWSNGITSTANPVSVVINGLLDVLASFNTPIMPPQVLAFPDTSIMEDQPFVMSFGWLKKFIMDGNDPFESLQLFFECGSHFTFVVNVSEQKASLIPAPNWNGEQHIICNVSDPIGMYDADTFLVSVIAVPDPPGPFGLVSPSDDMVLHDLNYPWEFRWKKSENVDAGDAITYSFYFSPSPYLSGLGTLKTAFLKDTTALLVPQLDGTYYWGVRAKDSQGYETWCDVIFEISIETGVGSEEEIPSTYHLFQNFPNPFNPETVIQYQLPKNDHVVLQIFDIRGSVVRILVEDQINAGVYKVLWDGKDQQGMLVSSGVYFVEIRTDQFIQHRKMILIR